MADEQEMSNMCHPGQSDLHLPYVDPVCHPRRSSAAQHLLSEEHSGSGKGCKLKKIILWPLELLKLTYITVGIFIFGEEGFEIWHENSAEQCPNAYPPLWKFFFIPAVIAVVFAKFFMRTAIMTTIGILRLIVGKKAKKNEAEDE